MGLELIAMMRKFYLSRGLAIDVAEVPFNEESFVANGVRIDSI